MDSFDISVEKKSRTWASEGSRRSFFKKPRVYIHIKDESLLENFANRTSRPVKEYREYVQHALEELNINYSSFHWSQNAGCSMCPCSPGFILTPEGFDSNYYRHEFAYDIWVRVEGIPVQTVSEEGVNRLAQLAAQV